MTFLLLLTNLLIGLPGPSPAPGCAVAANAGGVAPPVFTADAPAGSETTVETVQQRRGQFVGLVTMGVFQRFDDSRQEAVFKRSDPARTVHDPGPLEDEAIASAGREALATLYARLKLKPHLACRAGRLSIGILPDDPVMAASVIDMLLALDGVQTVTATLPRSLRMP